MKINYVLIDYENVKATTIELLADERFRVTVFLGPHDTRLPLEMVVAMQRLGASGYWELRLPVPAGEHRFAYILAGQKRMADPTLPAVERDDFGGENSILNVEVRI